MKNEFLHEAVRIGEQLLTTAKRDEHGTYWRTADMNTETKEIEWNLSENIYSGVSGIVLFLLALFQATNDEKYLKTSQNAMQWVKWYCKKNPTTYYALFTGRLGVSFAYLKLYNVTKKNTYLKEALSIAKGSTTFLENTYTIHDLINGISGTLLGLLLLHEATNEPWLLDHIQVYTSQLLQNANFDDNGLYWDSNQNEIHPLCGFSHGSSGIGFVFLQLGRYFKNPAYYYIAEQAFSYENSKYNKKANGWPDFRLNMYTQDKLHEYEESYKKGNLKIFTKPSFMNAWCHGAPGIGLSRLEALQLLKNRTYAHDIKNAYDTTSHTHLESFTLCHGNCGNAEFFIENFLSLKNKKALHEAERIAKEALEQKKSNGQYISGYYYNPAELAEDPSFFNGISGIGYFLLRVGNPHMFSSILAPKINSFAKSAIKNDTVSSIRKLFLSKSFKKTLRLIEEIEGKKLQTYLKDKPSSKEIITFITFVEKLLKASKKGKHQILNDTFVYELTKVQLLANTVSNGLLYIKDRVNKEKAEKLLKLSDKTLLQKSFRLAPEIKLLSLTAEEHTFFLFRLTAFGIEELAVSQFCYLVLHAFMHNKTIAEVIEEMYRMYKAKTSTDKKMVKEKTLTQIKEAIKYGILVPDSDKRFI